MNTKAPSRWNAFWFSDEPYFDLALLRIATVILQLITLVSVQFEQLTRVVSLPPSLYHPVALVRLVMIPWGWTTPPNGHVMFAVYGIALLFGVGALIGLGTRVCMIVLAAGSLFVQAYVYSFVDFHHNEAILLLALTAIALGPCGRVLSVDSLLARRQHKQGHKVPLLDYRGPDAGWPIKFVQVLFPLIYLSAAISKISSSGYSLDWANGYTLQYYFLQDSIRKPDMALGLWLSQFHLFILLSQIVVLTYQLTYFLVVPFRKLRWIYLPLGLFFHLANYYALRAPFPEWILLLGVYIPWTEALKRLVASEVYAPQSTAEVSRVTATPLVPDST